MKTKFTIIVVLGILSFLLTLPMGKVRATGDMQITWHTPHGKPLFIVGDLKPCDIEVRTVTLWNKSKFTRTLAIKVQETSIHGILPAALDVVISNNGSDLYGGTKGAKTLQNLIDESATLKGVFLTNIPPHSKVTLTLTVSFPCQSGNEYQAATTKFDILFFIDDQHVPHCYPIPPTCKFFYPYRHWPFFTPICSRACKGYSDDEIHNSCD